jgi:plasmid stabilization system protein ParE
MARLELAPEILEDFDRILAHLAQYEVAEAPARIATIIAALDILRHSPLIGRPLPGGLRELLIGRGAMTYLALYRFLPAAETVFVLAIRHAREAGYRQAP